MEIESTISDITANSAVFSWEETVDVDEYACVLSTEGVPESGTQLSPADIAAHKVAITGLASSTEYTAYAFATALYVLVSPLQLRKVNRRGILK